MTDDSTLQWLRNRIEIQEAALRFGRAVYSRDDGRSAGHEALRSGVIEIPATSTVIDPDEIADRGWKITRDRSEVEPRLREPRTEFVGCDGRRPRRSYRRLGFSVSDGSPAATPR